MMVTKVLAEGKGIIARWCLKEAGVQSYEPSDGRVIATQPPESHLLERIKEQWVRIHYPATAR